MQPFRGRYRLFEAGATASPQEREATVELTDDGVTVTAVGEAALPIAFAEVSTWEAKEYALSLTLAEGRRVVLSHLAKRYEELTRLFREMRRDHFSKALLFEERGDWAIEAGELRRRSPTASEELSGSGHVRLQRTSLVVIPDQARPFLVPYGEIRGLAFDMESYALRLDQGAFGSLELGKFGKRTDALRRGLEERVTALSARTGRTLALVAPDLAPTALRRVGDLLRDGVAASREELETAAPGFWQALWQVGFLPERRPYAEALAAQATVALVAIKETAPEKEETEAAPDDAPATRADVAELRTAVAKASVGEKVPVEAPKKPVKAPPPEEPAVPALWTTRQLLYLFVIGDAVVLEVPTQQDFATYVYRADGEPLRRVHSLCRSLSMVQFRREPIFLDEEALNSPKGLRYREAARTLDDLRQVRAAFAGRAIHASLEAWQSDLSAALEACKVRR